MMEGCSVIHMESKGVRVCTFTNPLVSGSKWTISFVRCDITPNQLRQMALRLEELNKNAP